MAPAGAPGTEQPRRLEALLPVEAESPTRTDLRRLRTRAALIQAAQQLLAEGRDTVPVLTITQLANVGLGSFYNHFATKEQLFDAALRDGLERLGAVLDELTQDLDDPAEVFARSFRITGRLFRRYPQVSGFLVRSGFELVRADTGLAPRARRDILAGVAAGRFSVEDTDVVVSMAAGSIIALGALLEQHPDRDEGRTTDEVTCHLLRMLGIPAEEAAAVCSRPLPSLEGVQLG